MAEGNPSMPAKSYRVSRMLRVLAFSFVVSTLAVGGLIEAFRFAFEKTVRRPYTDQGILLLLSVLLFTFVLARIIWDSAEGRYPPRPERKKT